MKDVTILFLHQNSGTRVSEGVILLSHACTHILLGVFFVFLRNSFEEHFSMGLVPFHLQSEKL